MASPAGTEDLSAAGNTGDFPAASAPDDSGVAAPSSPEGASLAGDRPSASAPESPDDSRPTSSESPAVDEPMASPTGTEDLSDVAAPSSPEGASLKGDCTSLPPADDYSAAGPFPDAAMFSSVGPGNNYTLFRPAASLGRDGFTHPIATWGNGISTTPDQYRGTLTHLASHGFVIIACNDTQAERPCLSDGMDWLISEASGSGELAGMLDPSREVTIGYSWGGGAAIDTADRPNVKATVSLHGMPPRGDTAFADMHAPLFLLTSTGDDFVSKSEYVDPNYAQSTVHTFYTTLDDANAGHLYVVDEGAASCLGGLLGLGACQGAIAERAPVAAWLRYWACDDARAGEWFIGDDCTLCAPPWTDTRVKN